MADIPEKLHNAEMEEALLGAVLTDPDQVPPLAAKLPAAAFHIARNRWIWEALQELHGQGQAIDQFTLAARLEAHGRFDEIGGPARLVELTDAPATSQHAESYAAELKNLYDRRELAAESQRMMMRACDLKRPLDGADPLHPRLEVHTAEEALQVPPGREWLVEGLITPASLNAFIGGPGSKKTFSMLSLAVCLAAGKPWLDMPTHQCRVLYIDEESSPEALGRRLGMALRGELLGGETPLLYTSLQGVRLDDPGSVAVLQALIKERGIRVVIVDALCDVMNGDENDIHLVVPVFRALRLVANDTRAAFIAVHHTNKKGIFLGSTAFKAEVDLMVKIESKNGDPFVDFTSEKVRDGAPLKWSARAIWPVSKPPQFHMEACIPGPAELKKLLPKSQQYVLEYLEQHGPSSMQAITAEPVACTAVTAKKAVYALVGMGKVFRSNPDEKGIGASAIYDLVSAVEDEK